VTVNGTFPKLSSCRSQNAAHNDAVAPANDSPEMPLAPQTHNPRSTAIANLLHVFGVYYDIANDT
jgi:hypothetical protein